MSYRDEEKYQEIFMMLLMSGEYREQDIDAQVRWHTVRGRVAPFLKNDYLGRIDGELRTGVAIDWRAMGMQA